MLSALDNTAYYVFFSSINHKYLSLAMSICFWFPAISYGYLHFSSLDYSIHQPRLSTPLISSLMITFPSPPKNHGRLSTVQILPSSHTYAVLISPNNLLTVSKWTKCSYPAFHQGYLILLVLTISHDSLLLSG